MELNQYVNMIIMQHYKQQNPKLQYIFNQMSSEVSPIQTLQTYSYQPSKPIYTKGNYNIYNGTHKQTNVAVTIKTLKGYHIELPKYLKKLKDCKSDNVIKIYQTTNDASLLVFVTEKVTFANLSKALLRCQRLDDADSIFMAKMILNGHTDLLRSDVNWFGTDEDIQFTDTGIKLSWNNSIAYNLVNPIPKILQKFSARPESQKQRKKKQKKKQEGKEKGKEEEEDKEELPFPDNKAMQQLKKVSKENASEISLNPQMKKKQKLAKKKGKNWLGLKEYRNKNQYFDQYVYFAVSEDFGFVRVKVYDKAKIDPQVIALNKNRTGFTKVIQYYDDGPKTIIISEYSNDGNLQAYVTKLKTSGIKLTEGNIQFFFYSLFEPLKLVQQSAVKSISTLHIRNIYIQNGIPKIGQPTPINQATAAIMIDRAQVPDFYHPDFKKQPSSHHETYDTYSLGVLLYKLMYTEYPIFPNGKVHMPSAPNYDKRLKNTLQIFLNEGGTLKSIQNRIEVSEKVAKKVKENKEKLIAVTKKDTGKDVKAAAENSKRPILGEDDEKQVTQKSQVSQQQKSEQDDDVGCCTLCCNRLQLGPNKESSQKSPSIIALEQSPYRIYRICTKIFLISIFYIFLFYFFFLQSSTLAIASQNILTSYNTTIATIDYEIITTDANKFQTVFNQTNKTIASLQGLGCLINKYNGNPDYKTFIYANSPGWTGFLVAGLLGFIVIILCKIWQLYQFDIVRAVYYKQHAKADFNISNWIIWNLLFCCLVYGHFYFFNFLFNGHTEPCVGGLNLYASTFTLFNNRTTFNTVYLTTVSLQLGIVLIQSIFIRLTLKIKYNKLLNPIVIFAPFVIVQWIICRIGAINEYFYPNLLQQGSIILNYFIKGEYINVFGFIPQILLIGDIAIGFFIDGLYWVFLDKRRRLMINETSALSLGEV